MADLPNPVVEDQNINDKPNQVESNETTKNICVIGAGPSGLAALQVILDHPLYKEGRWRAAAYEGREDVGGIWLAAPSREGEIPETPLYDSLTTNLPHPVMAYTTYSFPPSTRLYPTAPTVQKYLRDYATHFNLLPHIQLNTVVQSVSWDSSRNKWTVRTRRTKIAPDVASEFAEETLYYDLVIVANGHYRRPRYPSTPGLKAWLESGHASHSIHYRNPSQPYIANAKKVLIIGAGPSGSDISSDLYEVPTKEVVHSFTASWYAAAKAESGRFKTRPRVKEFLPVNEQGEGSVVFVDGSIETGINHCILATGYENSFPFLEPGSSDAPPVELGFPPSIPPLPSKLYNSTYHIFPLAKQIWPLVSSFPPSSLAFLGLPFRVLPFPLVEAQARAVLKVFADPSNLDLTQEAVDVVSRYEELAATVPPDHPYPRDVAVARLWHQLDNNVQFNYRDALHEFVGGEYAKSEYKVPDWVKEVYAKKWELRAAWKTLEKTGEAKKWNEGVGEGKSGKDATSEWVDLMHRVLEWAESPTTHRL